MKSFRLLLISVTLCFWFQPFATIAQTGETSNASLIPQIVPATPEAASIARYGLYPVSHYTGVPEIQIPLYEISVGRLVVPISLSYHASGIRVTDRASWVGLGWTLQCGGQISRKIVGLEDEHFNGYLNMKPRPLSEISKYDPDDLNYLNGVNTGVIDTEPDIFSYALPGHSGKFFFNHNRNYAIAKIPYTPLTIRRLSNLSFEMVSVSGDSYLFNGPTETDDTNRGIATAWPLSKIISAEKHDTISFSYKMRSGQIHADLIDYVVVSDQIDGSAYQSDQGVYNVRSQAVWGTEQRVSQIDYPLGKVTFECASTDREDGFPGQKRLQAVHIYTLDPATGEPALLKTIVFHHSYFVSTDGSDKKRLRLDSLSVVGADNTVLHRYKFEYNPLALPDFFSKARDYWGYYNNAHNQSLVPAMEIPYQNSVASPASSIQIGGSVNGRESSPIYMQACILTRITYPTGGWTNFVYAPNKYLNSNGQPKFAGGLRLEEIRSYDGTGADPLITTYRYGSGESGYGRPNFLLSNYFFQSQVTRRFFHHESPSDLCPVFAGRKRERTFVANSSIDNETFDASPVTYSVVTEYNGTPVRNSGKTVYLFNDPGDNLSTPIVNGQPRLRSCHFKRGLLLSKTVFKSTPSGYRKVYSLSNSYHAFADSTIANVGFVCRKHIITDMKRGPNVTDTDVFTGTSGCGMTDSESYLFGFYGILTGDAKLTSTTEIYYDQNDQNRSLSTTVRYSFDNYRHQQITRTTTWNSRGDVIEKIVKYPHESAGTVYTSMIEKNQWAYPVEELTKLNGSQVEKITRSYVGLYSHVFRPRTVYRQFLASDPNELQVTFTGYDLRGNPTGFVGSDEIPYAVIWGYRRQLPVCYTANADPSNIFYTSFEETQTSTSATHAKTGRRSLYNVLYTVPVPASGNYVLTYWKKTGTAEWQHVSQPVTGTQVTIGGSNTWIDEVRLHPVFASMSTYTYRMGAGMTSSNDSNAYASFYDFDQYGRLQAVKDHDGNITRSYEYRHVRP